MTRPHLLTGKPAVPEHCLLKAGDFDPELGKTIKELTLSDNDFLVYIDTELNIQWRATDDHKASAHCGEVLNRVGILEAQAHFLEDQHALLSIKRQIAEGLARCLNGYSREDSMPALDEAEAQLAARNKETAWKWYFTASYFVSGACVGLFILLWTGRSCFSKFLGQTAFEVSLGILMGAVGALLSATTRANRLVLDAKAGSTILRLEGLSRIGAGLIGALLVALSVKSGIILGGVQFSGGQLAVLLAMCLAAGASERIVPSLVETFEKLAAAPRTNSEGATQTRIARNAVKSSPPTEDRDGTPQAGTACAPEASPHSTTNERT